MANILSNISLVFWYKRLSNLVGNVALPILNQKRMVSSKKCDFSCIGEWLGLIYGMDGCGIKLLIITMKIDWNHFSDCFVAEIAELSTNTIGPNESFCAFGLRSREIDINFHSDFSIVVVLEENSYYSKRNEHFYSSRRWKTAIPDFWMSNIQAIVRLSSKSMSMNKWNHMRRIVYRLYWRKMRNCCPLSLPQWTHSCRRYE